MSTAPASHATASSNRDHRWLALLFIGIAELMVVLDATIVNIALPSAQADLGFGDEQRQWIVTAYSLAFGSLLLLGGRLSDLFGRKNTFLIGLAGFAGASVIGGLADSFGMLVAARALQGVFGALLAPAALSLLTTTFRDPKERGQAFGVFGAIAGSGAATGMLLGGALTEYASWRWCLYVNVLFAVVGLIGGVIFIARPPSVEQRPRIDVPGVLTITAGLVAIVGGFSSAETDGWSAPLTISLLVGGLVLIAVFVVIQSRASHPLLPLRILLDRDRSGAFLAIGLVAIGMFALFLFLTYYLQQTLGFSAMQTGLSFLPMPLSITLSSTQIAARLLPRVGPRILIAVGALLSAGGMLLLLRTEADSNYWTVVLPALVVAGLGMGLIFTSAMNTATSGVAPQDAGVASATVNTMQQIGGSIGTAFLSSVYASVVASRIDGLGHTASAVEQADATLAAYHAVFTTSAAVLALIAVVSILLMRRHGTRQAERATASPDATT